MAFPSPSVKNVLISTQCHCSYLILSDNVREGWVLFAALVQLGHAAVIVGDVAGEHRELGAASQDYIHHLLTVLPVRGRHAC